MADGRTFWPVTLLGAGSAALAAVAASRTWGTAEVAGQGGRVVKATGTEVAPLVLALALVALAAWGTILVLRARARRVVAVLGLAASVGAVVAALASHSRIAESAERLAGEVDATTAQSGWFLVCVLSGITTAVGLAAAVMLASRWPEMPSRYDAPGDGAPDQTDLWKALDQGHDPTV